MQKSLLTFILCLLTTVGTFAYSVGDIVKSYALPIYFKSTTQYGSITQQIHLASELTSQGGKAGQNISSITFYYSAKDGASVSALSRPIQVWILSIPSSTTEYVVDTVAWPSGAGYDGYSHFLCDGNNKPGTLVYTGNLSTNDVSSSPAKSVKLTFNENDFRWDGTSNIAITICDQSTTAHTIDADSYANLRFSIQYTGVETPRFLCKQWKTGDTDTRSAWLSNLLIDYGDFYPHDTSNRSVQKQKENRSWVNKIDFAFEDAPAPTAPSTPENLAASNIGTNSVSLSWTAEGATSYSLVYSVDGELYNELATPSSNSYDWSGLTAETTYYVKVAAVNGVDTSDYSEPISFTTLAPHTHDGITFEPWSNPSAMPTSGSYYLATDVAYDFYEGGYLDLAGDLNLCLNGHTINLGTKSINVTADHRMTIFDPIGGGKITGFVPGHAGTVDYMGVISVENNGTLVLREGEVENTYPADDPEYKSIAVAVGGTLILSGSPVISSNEMDIYLPPTIPAKVITIEPGKPLTNTTPYKVYKSSGVITSGWANMSGANPRDYFVSANSEKSICLSEDEAALRTLLNLSENSNNSAIGSLYNQIVDVNLTRSLTSAQYNTFCLPFALDGDQLTEFFGSGYDLEELSSSSLDGELLTLVFNRVYELEAGKPYLLQPASNVADPSFEGVTITATSPVNVTTSYIDFKPVYGPTSLTGGNKNLLFLGADNELFWPDATGNLKGFRAYFEVKGAAQKAAKRARIVKKEDSATGIDQITNDKSPMTNKIIKDNQLLILRDNKTYNVIGQMVK